METIYRKEQPQKIRKNPQMREEYIQFEEVSGMSPALQERWQAIIKPEKTTVIKQITRKISQVKTPDVSELIMFFVYCVVLCIKIALIAVFLTFKGFYLLLSAISDYLTQPKSVVSHRHDESVDVDINVSVSINNHKL